MILLVLLPPNFFELFFINILEFQVEEWNEGVFLNFRRRSENNNKFLLALGT